jgi:non-ribosomal peptide synthetase component F
MNQRIYYEGRVDRQVKRWGHRMQLDDIEKQIISCNEDIEQCW